jgi:hypothetical protein
MRPRPILLLYVSLEILAFACFACRKSSSQPQSVPVITKEAVAFTNHVFDPASPPPDMPPLSAGESAECDSDFRSNASLLWQPGQTDATHVIVTITQVKMTLQLRINIWVPVGASQHLIEHEEGHRQISESYYEAADKLAAQIAAPYVGRQVEVTGTDLAAESDKMVQQMAKEITTEYNKQLDPSPAQLLYDSITDHSRNGVAAKDAVAHALKNVLIEGNGAKSP